MISPLRLRAIFTTIGTYSSAGCAQWTSVAYTAPLVARLGTGPAQATDPVVQGEPKSTPLAKVRYIYARSHGVRPASAFSSTETS
jgi:hypothetical protein